MSQLLPVAAQTWHPMFQIGGNCRKQRLSKATGYLYFHTQIRSCISLRTYGGALTEIILLNLLFQERGFHVVKSRFADGNGSTRAATTSARPVLLRPSWGDGGKCWRHCPVPDSAA